MKGNLISCIILTLFLSASSFSIAQQGNDFGDVTPLVETYVKYIQVKNYEGKSLVGGPLEIYYCPVSPNYKTWTRTDFVTLAEHRVGFKFFNSLYALTTAALETESDGKTFGKFATNAQKALAYLKPDDIDLRDFCRLILSVSDETKNVRDALKIGTKDDGKLLNSASSNPSNNSPRSVRPVAESTSEQSTTSANKVEIDRTDPTFNYRVVLGFIKVFDKSIINVPADPQKWTQDNLVKLATTNVDGVAAFDALVLLRIAANEEDNSGNFTKKAGTAQQALAQLMPKNYGNVQQNLIHFINDIDAVDKLTERNSVRVAAHAKSTPSAIPPPYSSRFK